MIGDGACSLDFMNLTTSPSLLTRQVSRGLVFHRRSNAAPIAFPDGRNDIEIGRFQRLKTCWSGGRDSNSRSPGPKPGALPS